MFTPINSTIFKGLPEVTNSISFNPKGPTPDGLYSETIFGVHTKDYSQNFAYISLGAHIFNPVIYHNLNRVDPLFKKLADPKYSTKAKIQDGLLVEDPDGKRGIPWLYSIWDQIDFDKYIKEGQRIVDNYNFGKFSKDEVFLNKWLVCPPLYRPAVQQNGMWVEDDITKLYKEIMRVANVKKGDSEIMDKLLNSSSKVDMIQEKVNKMFDTITALIFSSSGLQEEKLVGKRMDNVARLVANASPRIPVHSVGLPWHTLLGLMDSLIIGHIYNMEPATRKEFLKSVELVDGMFPKDFGKHFDYIYRNADVYTSTPKGKEKRTAWIKLLEEVIENNREIRFLVKRDPAWTRESFHSLAPIIITDNAYHVMVNSFLYVPLGGDSFSSKIIGVYKNSKTIIKKEIFTENNYETVFIKSVKNNKIITMKSSSIFSKL